MIKNVDECPSRMVDELAGGKGAVKMIELASSEEMYGKARLFSKLVLAPGSSVGYHTHHGESEFYFILRGKAMFVDNGVEHVIGPGTITATRDGQSHSIENIGDEDLEFIAFIPQM